MPLTHPDQPDRVKGLPCRAHLYATLSAVVFPHRRMARWEIPAYLWALIKDDPDLKVEAFERDGYRTSGGHKRTLCGLPVDVLDRTDLDAVVLIVPVQCNQDSRK